MKLGPLWRSFFKLNINHEGNSRRSKEQLSSQEDERHCSLTCRIPSMFVFKNLYFIIQKLYFILENIWPWAAVGTLRRSLKCTADGQREGEHKTYHTKACCFLSPWLECCICWSKVRSAIWMHTWESKVKWRWWNVTVQFRMKRHRGHLIWWFLIGLHIRITRELCPSESSPWLRSTYHVPSPTYPFHPCSSPVKEDFIVAPFCWHGNWNSERWSAQGHPDGRRWKSFGSQMVYLPKLLTSSLHCFQNTNPHGAFGPLTPKHPCHSEHWSLTSPPYFADRNLSSQKELLPEGRGASLHSPKLTQQQTATLYVAPALSSMQLPPSANFKLHVDSGKQWLGEKFACELP